MVQEVGKQDAQQENTVEETDSENDEDFVLSESESSVEKSDVDEEGLQNEQRLPENKDTQFMLNEFLDWVQDVDGRERELDAALQNVRQVRTIISTIDPKNLDAKLLLDRNVVRDCWLAPFRNSKRKPGTIRS